MPHYVRVYPNYSFEFIVISGKWKKKRYHFLINPDQQISLDVTQKSDEVASVNPKSLTHIITVENSTNGNQILKKTFDLAELLNKPVIATPIVAEQLRNMGLSVTQIRTIESDNSGIDDLQIKLVYFTLQEFAPELEHVDSEDDSLGKKIVSTPVNLVSKLVTLSFKPLQKTLKPLIKPFNPAKIKMGKYQNPFKKNHKMTESINREHPMILALIIDKQSFVFPLDAHGSEYLAKSIEVLDVDWIILPDAHVQKTNKYKTEGGRMLLVDTQFKGEPIMIPQSRNSFIDHDTVLVPYYEWIDLDEYTQ